MATYKDREHFRQLSIVAYVIMLALIVPLTMFLAQQEQKVKSEASYRTAPLAISPTVVPSSTVIPYP